MIPKKIHYCWIGGNPLPASAKKCIASWRKYCPDYEIIEWNETNYDFTKIPYMKQAYEAKKWGFVPDYARLDIVYQYGGIYLDTDVEIVKSFDSLLELKGFAGFESEDGVNFGQGFGAEAGSRELKRLMVSYESMSFINADGTLNLVPSPQLNTKELVNMGLRTDGTRQKVGELSVFPTEYFCPKSFEDGIVRKTKNTYSIHHFDSSWFTAEQQANKELRWKRAKREVYIASVRKAIKKIFITLFGEKAFDRLLTHLKG